MNSDFLQCPKDRPYQARLRVVPNIHHPNYSIARFHRDDMLEAYARSTPRYGVLVEILAETINRHRKGLIIPILLPPKLTYAIDDYLADGWDIKWLGESLIIDIVALPKFFKDTTPYADLSLSEIQTQPQAAYNTKEEENRYFARLERGPNLLRSVQDQKGLYYDRWIIDWV